MAPFIPFILVGDGAFACAKLAWTCFKYNIAFVSSGFCPIAIRWVLVKDPTEEMAPLPLMRTDVNLTAMKIIELYVDRWGLEVTFFEAREHLGVETQKQWSDKAIARTTPILMSLYTIVCLMGHRLNEETPLIAEKAAWYDKETITFGGFFCCRGERII